MKMHDESSAKAPSLVERCTRFYQPDCLDMEAWFEIAGRDYRELIATFDFASLLSAERGPIRLLDVGCGTGKFPSMLRPLLDDAARITYDQLDPSAHCVQACRDSLRAPFVAGRSFICTLQDLMQAEVQGGASDVGPCTSAEGSAAASDNTAPADGYDLVWCIHSLWSIRDEDIASTLEKLRHLVRPRAGKVIIFQQSTQSSYSRIFDSYRDYLRGLGLDVPPAYTGAEGFRDAAVQLGVDMAARRIEYEHVVPCNADTLLEKYLRKCLLQDSDINDWLQADGTRALLSDFKQTNSYRFPQTSWILDFGAS